MNEEQGRRRSSREAEIRLRQIVDAYEGLVFETGSALDEDSKAIKAVLIELDSARAREAALLEGLRAAGRLNSLLYLPWDMAGGPDECEHGYSAGIPCMKCDEATLARLLLPAATPPAPAEAGREEGGAGEG